MVKIDIVSGFLGAGKTTLIKKLLKDAFQGEQVVLIENEFGEIGIDGGFLKESGIEIREMNSGCICCSLVGDFGTSLREVIETYHPDRILIEPSGVGKLSDIIVAVQNVQADIPEMVLNSYTTVVDAKKCKMYMRNFGEFFNNQVECAGAIVMSRTDIADEAKVTETMEMLRTLNAKAAIITTPIDQLDGKKLLEVMENPVSLEDELLEEAREHQHEHHHHHDHDHDDDDHDEHEHHHHHDHDHDDDHDEHEHHHHDHDDDHDEHEHHHHDHEHHHHHHHDHDADEIFTSWGRETIKKYSKDSISKILEALTTSDEYGMILRAKGMVPAEDGTWIHFDMVPEETEIREGAADFTGRLCVIGSELKEDKIAELFGL